MSTVTPLYFLSGPTASGKTTVAHHLAERLNLRLLSVDSMMVYRGMDIGTAKPTAEEISRYDYAGVNLIDAGTPFSTGKWLRAICEQLDERPTLAVGGTGLYYRALIDGLTPESTRDQKHRSRSVEELQKEIRQRNPEVLQQLADPENQRRLERALAWLESGQTPPRMWAERAGFPLPVLRRPTEILNERIEQRIRVMFQTGLLKETQTLLNAGALTGTAAQAIGYQEAQAVIHQTCTLEQAITQLATRTRRYAKRQRTWFRNQMDARWVDVENEHSTELIADKVAGLWEDTGPFLFEHPVND
ncbi:tRNA (adenosine(37)-N6)-dimethylallyltransferase MiaA [Kiritimatiellota bacterium B12222]|nr:tRNA (adenosine(37)-N6)-dimethylallyltransferase MiaA [Kiritimatiellota bacterium B12222]